MAVKNLPKVIYKGNSICDITKKDILLDIANNLAPNFHIPSDNAFSRIIYLFINPVSECIVLPGKFKRFQKTSVFCAVNLGGQQTIKLLNLVLQILYSNVQQSQQSCNTNQHSPNEPSHKPLCMSAGLYSTAAHKDICCRFPVFNKRWASQKIKSFEFRTVKVSRRTEIQVSPEHKLQ